MKPIFLSLNVERWTLDVGRLEEPEANAQRPTLNVRHSIRQ